MWAAGVGLLLAVFCAVDRWHQVRRPVPPPAAEPGNSWRLEGKRNLFFLAVILGAVFVEHPVFLREGLMAAAAAGSYFTTKKSVQAANGFTFHPLREVAVLFAGIFATMIPVLDWLAGPAMARLGSHATPGLLYWGSGLLSGVLDSAPAYLAAFSTLAGGAGGADPAGLLAHQAAGLTAVSVGTVFFGAATYLGNGPNFMVKAMAEERNVPMPSLAGMVLRYTLPVLLPVLGVVWACFFRS
jgi:Na+/H+ antiporter NhaD/arsenite permease-like protein